MIQVVDGIGVGSGKSYFVCGRIMGHLAAGGTVYCAETFGFEFDKARQLIADRWGVEIEADQYHVIPEADISRIHEVTRPGTAEMPVLVVVDEAQRELNARDWNDKSKRALFDWLCESRHDDNDLIFISQSANNIDKQVRRLVTEIVRCVNLKATKVPLLSGLPVFVQLTMHQDGTTVMSRRWVRHDSKVFGCYVSKACRGRHKRLAGEIPRKALRRVQSKKSMKAFLIIFFVLLAVVVYGVSKAKNGVLGGEKSKAALAATPVPVPPPSARLVARPAWDIVTEEFRGFISEPATKFHVLKTSGGWYELGEMSGKGLVVGLSDRRARVVGADGRNVFVVAEDSASARATPAPATPAPRATPAPEEKPVDDMFRVQAGLPSVADGDRMRNVQAGLPARSIAVQSSPDRARGEEESSGALQRRRARAGLSKTHATGG